MSFVTDEIREEWLLFSRKELILPTLFVIGAIFILILSCKVQNSKFMMMLCYGLFTVAAITILYYFVTGIRETYLFINDIEKYYELYVDNKLLDLDIQMNSNFTMQYRGSLGGACNLRNIGFCFLLFNALKGHICMMEEDGK